MQVRELGRGDFFETIVDGAPSGNIYRVADVNPRGGLSLCHKQYTGERVRVHPDCECRKLDPETLDGF